MTEDTENKGTVAFSASWQPRTCFMGSKCEVAEFALGIGKKWWNKNVDTTTP